MVEMFSVLCCSVFESDIRCSNKGSDTLQADGDGCFRRQFVSIFQLHMEVKLHFLRG
jgi:hypothetical protein